MHVSATDYSAGSGQHKLPFNLQSRCGLLTAGSSYGQFLWPAEGVFTTVRSCGVCFPLASR
jgi:hypothetical protein